MENIPEDGYTANTMKIRFRYGRYRLDNQCVDSADSPQTFIDNTELTVEADDNGKLRAYKTGTGRTRVAENRRALL